MRDFSTKYRGVVHFGLWKEEVADLYGQHDAWAVIAQAVKLTTNEDVRSTELEDALGYLRTFTTRDRPFKDFREALCIADPIERYAALKESAERIGRALGS